MVLARALVSFALPAVCELGTRRLDALVSFLDIMLSSFFSFFHSPPPPSNSCALSTFPQFSPAGEETRTLFHCCVCGSMRGLLPASSFLAAANTPLIVYVICAALLRQAASHYLLWPHLARRTWTNFFGQNKRTNRCQTRQTDASSEQSQTK